MDNAVILAKMEALQHCVARIQSRIPASIENLIDDYDWEGEL